MTHDNLTRLSLLQTYSSLHKEAVSSLVTCGGEEETFIAGGYDGRLFTLSSIQGTEASPPLQIDERSGKVLAMALGGGKKTLAVGSNDHSISIYA